MEAKRIECDHCGRYIGTAHGTTIAELVCPNSRCKAEKQVKIVTADTSKAMAFKFATAPKPPKENTKESNNAASN